MNQKIKKFKTDLKKLRNPPKNSTITVYGWHAKKFLEWWEKQDKLTRDDPGTQIINEFAEDISEERDWEKGTTYVAVEAVRNYLGLEWNKTMDPRYLKNPGKESNYEPKIFSWDDVRTVFDAVDNRWRNDQKRAMFYLSWGGALRAGETVRIQDQDFDFVKGVFSPRTLKSKGKKSPRKNIQSEAMPDGTMDLAKKYVGRSHNYTFYRDQKGRRFVSGEWSSLVGDLLTDVLDIERTRHLTHNFFRDTRGTLMAEEEDNNFLDVLLLLGHSDPKTALKYFEQAGREVSSELKTRL